MQSICFAVRPACSRALVCAVGLADFVVGETGIALVLADKRVNLASFRDVHHIEVRNTLKAPSQQVLVLCGTPAEGREGATGPLLDCCVKLDTPTTATSSCRH